MRTWQEGNECGDKALNLFEIPSDLRSELRRNGEMPLWKIQSEIFKNVLKISFIFIKYVLTCPISLFKFVYVGLSISRFRRQISYMASLSTMKAQSECSKVVCVVNIEL